MIYLVLAKIGIALLTGIGLGTGFYLAQVITYNTLTFPFEKFKEQRLAGKPPDWKQIYENFAWLFPPKPAEPETQV